MFYLWENYLNFHRKVQVYCCLELHLSKIIPFHLAVSFNHVEDIFITRIKFKWAPFLFVNFSWAVLSVSSFLLIPFWKGINIIWEVKFNILYGIVFIIGFDVFGLFITQTELSDSVSRRYWEFRFCFI